MLKSHLHLERLVRLVSRRKIVYVIVEGPSDDIALGAILQRFFDRDMVHVEIIHGDITSDLEVNKSNIVAKIGNTIKSYANAYHFKQDDFKEVIHLVDTDGAFIGEDCIVKDIAANKPMYSLKNIHTNNPEKLKLRNKRKSENLNQIAHLNKVWKSIPYKAYYMSCNLDHVLYNKLNSSDDEKENNAYAFARRYKNDIDEFLAFILDSNFSKINDFKDSWKFIMTEKHSLERWSNLGICFKEIKKEQDKI